MADNKGSVVAIDGPAGSGKSTVAKAVAKKLGYLYVDTGAMYRCVALAVKRRGLDLENRDDIAALAKEVDIRLESSPDGLRVLLNGEEVENEIRDPEISKMTSRYVANIPGVRDAMVERQRKLGEGGAVVMEGRDIGTVVFPGADLKIYFNVTVGERARRRISDYQARGIEFDPARVRQDLENRDQEDRSRPRGALKKAEDSIEILGDGKTVEALVDEILAHLP